MAVTAVSAQPFKFTPGPFEPELLEADQRIQSNFTGFVFNFANATVRHTCPAVRASLLQLHSKSRKHWPVHHIVRIQSICCRRA